MNDDRGSVLLTPVDLHNWSDDRHDDGHRDTKTLAVIRQSEGVVSRRRCDDAFLFLFLQIVTNQLFKTKATKYGGSNTNCSVAK